MSQYDAVRFTTLFVIDLIRTLKPGEPVQLDELAEALRTAIAKPAEGDLWFTFGPHASLDEFLFELQALGDVAITGNSVRLTTGGEQLLAESANQLPGLSAKLGIAA
jgi:hypothetical protein